MCVPISVCVKLSSMTLSILSVKPLTSEKFQPSNIHLHCFVHTCVIMLHFLFAHSCRLHCGPLKFMLVVLPCSQLLLPLSFLTLLYYFTISPFLQRPFLQIKKTATFPRSSLSQDNKYPTSNCLRSSDNANAKPICKCV